MTPHQYDLLRALSKSPRTLRSFTHAPSVEQTRVSPYVIELNMKKLFDAGFVGREGPHYFITSEGARQVDLSIPTAPQPYSTETWKPQPWTPARPGADDHLQYSSVGDAC